MRALDAAHVEKTGVAADQRAAREHQFWQRLQPACGNRARAVRNALGAFKESADRRVRFVALEFFVRRQVRVFVRQADHVADHDLVVFHVVQE